MALPITATVDDLRREHFRPDATTEVAPASASAVSWAAVMAGAAGAAALSLILLILGTGLGLSSVSPWAQDGISATTFGVSTIVWLTVTQLLAAGMGGYLAGRLRTRWTDVQRDEAYFRDTAHGFLAWAVASLVTAATLTSAVGAITSRGVQAGGIVAAGIEAVKADDNSAPSSYFVDSLFRRDASAMASVSVGNGFGAGGALGGDTTATKEEVNRIFMKNMQIKVMPMEDVRYVGLLVAQRTGLPLQAAEKRVTDTHSRMQTSLNEAKATAMQMVDDARKASARASLWLFVALLSGAFVASLAATFGGRQRDA